MATDNRYTVVVSDHGSEWTKVYDGISKRQFLRNFCYWASKGGVKLLVICPHDTDPLLTLDHTAEVDIRTYPGR